MKKLFSYGVLLAAMTFMLGSADQSEAMPILGKLGSKHTFYITSEWATHDQQSVSHVQNFADLLGGPKRDFRLNNVNLEVFYVGGVQRCDLPTRTGGGWFSSGSSSYAANSFGSRHSSSYGGGSYSRDHDRDRWQYEGPEGWPNGDPEDPPPWIVDGFPNCPSPDDDGHHHHHGSAPVPEPATMLLVGSGLAFLAGRHLRKKQLKG